MYELKDHDVMDNYVTFTGIFPFSTLKAASARQSEHSSFPLLCEMVLHATQTVSTR